MASRLEVVSRNVKKIGNSDIVIVQDEKTGVLYAYGESRGGEGSFFSPLLDANGKPVVEPLNYIEE